MTTKELFRKKSEAIWNLIRRIQKRIESPYYLNIEEEDYSPFPEDDEDFYEESNIECRVMCHGEDNNIQTVSVYGYPLYCDTHEKWVKIKPAIQFIAYFTKSKDLSAAERKTFEALDSFYKMST